MLGKDSSKQLMTTKTVGTAQAAAASVFELPTDLLAACGTSTSTNVSHQPTDVEEVKFDLNPRPTAVDQYIDGYHY